MEGFIILILLYNFIDYYSSNIYVIISSCAKNEKQNINNIYIPYKVVTLFCNKSTNHIDSLEVYIFIQIMLKHGMKEKAFMQG